MSEKLRIGLVGLGTYAEIAHLPTYLNSPYAADVELAAICDLNESRLNEIGDKHGIAGRYTDLNKMLAEANLDAVSIVTPDHAHTAVVNMSLAAGLDVMVEKPLAQTVKDCDEMIRAARAAKRRLHTDFHKRCDPCHQEARARLFEGHYGQVQAGFVWMQDRICIPAGGFFKTDLAAKSSPVWFLAVHFYDLLRFLTGLEPVEVRAVGHRQVLAKRGIPTWDSVKADFIFTGGATMSFLVAWHLPDTLPNFTKQGVYLQCTEGELTIDTMNRGYYEVTPKEYRCINPMYTRRTPAGVQGYAHESIGEALREFKRLKDAGEKRDALYETLEKDDPTTLDGLVATLMAQATHLSLDEGENLGDGQVRIGAPVKLKDLLADHLGPAAKAYPF